MLVLSRKKNETLRIGEGISITVIRVSGNKVRLGITAPKELPVMRTELQAKSTTVDIEAPRAPRMAG